MKRQSELIWELGLALVAFAGGFTLLNSFFPSIPPYVFGGLFAVAFIVMFVSFAIRFYENQHPISLFVSDVCVDTIDEPILEITLGFYAHDKVNINGLVAVRFDKKLEAQIREIATFHPVCLLNTKDKEYIIKLEAGDYVKVSGAMLLHIYNHSKQEIEAIEFIEGTIEAGWNIVGHKRSWARLNCTYNWQDESLLKRYPSMHRKRGYKEFYDVRKTDN